MKICRILGPIIILMGLSSLFAQSQLGDHLSSDEIRAATALKPGSGFVAIMDSGFLTPSLCKAQMPEEFIYTPEGWLNALSINARHQYLPFNPQPEDTLRALTIISQGCASGTLSGPACDSITRVVLLSDKDGSVVIEAVDSHPRSSTWQNGFGATAACSSLVSKFTMADVQKARNEKGEFLIATFDGATHLKTYTVKSRFIKKLGL